MRYLLFLIGLIGLLMLFQPETGQQQETYEPIDYQTSVSQKEISPFSAIENPEVTFSFCNIYSKLPVQKRGNDNLNPALTRRVNKTEACISQETYIIHKSTSLFLIYQFSLSLFRILRQ